MSKTKGLALIVVIIIIVASAVVILGIASLISTSLTLDIVEAAMEDAISAAQAGIYAGINDYLASPGQPYWSKAVGTNVVGDSYYSVGKDANFLLVDADSPQTSNSGGGSNNLLRNVPLSNISQTQAITVNQVKVEWYNFGGSLNRIELGNTTRWTGTASSGTTVTLSSPFTLAAQQSFTGVGHNAWRFTVSIPNNAIVLVTFYFTGGSSRKAYLLNNGRSGNKEFSITATGEVRGATRWKRTIEATYDVGVNRITSWQESDSHI